MPSVDVIVLGMGPGGEHVAGELAAAGLEVLGIDQALVGGECPYWGCIPSKMMVRAANLLADARRVPSMAGSATVSPDWTPVAERIRDEATDNWDDGVAVARFEGKGGRFVRGQGRLLDARSVEVAGARWEARRGVVIATGGVASRPPIPGLESVDVWTNREAVAALTPPSSLVILGGGAIGVEFGQVFARFGSEVVIVESETQLLPRDEPEAASVLSEALQAEGVQVFTGVSATSVAADEGGVRVELEDGESVRGSRLLLATGRRIDLAGIGAGAIGVDETGQSLPVDEHLRVTAGVWAVGDVTGRGAFTHMAMYQANIVIADILGRATHSADYRAVPRVTFTDPEIGAVGQTEAQAREAGIRVTTGSSSVPESARGWIHKAGNHGFTKLVADADRGVLVGATSAGPAGGEVLGLLTLAVHASIPLEQLRSMIYAYPTFHRGVEDALSSMNAG